MGARVPSILPAKKLCDLSDSVNPPPVMQFTCPHNLLLQVLRRASVTLDASNYCIFKLPSLGLNWACCVVEVSDARDVKADGCAGGSGVRNNPTSIFSSL